MPGGNIFPPGCAFQGSRGEHMPLRETPPKLTPEQYEKNFADITPPLNSRQAAASRPLRCIVLLRCPLYNCLSHDHRRSGLYQAHYDRQRSRRGARNPRSKHSGRKLRARLPHRGAMWKASMSWSRRAKKAIKEIGRLQGATRSIMFSTAKYACSTLACRMDGASHASARARHPWRAQRGVALPRLPK